MQVRKETRSSGFFVSLDPKMASANIPGHLVHPNLDMDVVPGSFRAALAKNKQKIVLGALLGADYKFNAGNQPRYTWVPINRVDYSWSRFFIFFC